MPRLVVSKSAGAAVFASHRLKLPTSWRQPSGAVAGAQYARAIAPPDRVATPALVPAWFTPHNGHRYHQKSCDEVGRAFRDLHDTALEAVTAAHDEWRARASFRDLRVMAVTAIGAPGCLDGPPLADLVRAAPVWAGSAGNAAAYRDAVSDGVGRCFDEWRAGVTVPALPWYPAFAAFPGPLAPPQPNVPTPLASCVSSAAPRITTPPPLRDAMIDALAPAVARADRGRHHVALFDALGAVLAPAFASWLMAQMVTGVLGRGPVPTFAPPAVPTGPVVGGDVIAAPGHLAS